MENQENQITQKEKIKNLPFKVLAVRLHDGEWACRIVYDNDAVRFISFSDGTITRSSFPEITSERLYLRGDERQCSNSVFFVRNGNVFKWATILVEKQDLLLNKL